MKTKAVVLVSGALVALLLLSRYFALSRAGLSAATPEGSVSERLSELEKLHARGAISDTECSAQRLQIIAKM